jgi:peptidoglycan hydrolase CwlO-like protein
MRITEIWQEKKKFNSKLVELANEIESKRGEIKEIKTKIAIEGNELNIMGLEIQKIENKIKELT